MAESLESGITCPLCLEIYQDPKVLPCGHIYCRDPCLTGLARQTNNTTVSCPECRKVAQIPQGDVNVFPTVYKIVSLVDSFKAKNTREDSDQPDSTTKECPIHTGQEIALYCKTCSKVLCRDCMLATQEHKDHQYSYIKNVVDKSREYLHIQSRQAESCSQTLERALESIKVIRERVSNQHDVIGREIDTRVERQRATLHSQLEQITKLKYKCLNEQQMKLTEAQSELDKTSAIIENVADNFSDVDLMVEMKRLQAMFEKVTLDSNAVDCNAVTSENIGICSDSSIATVRQVYLYSGEPADPSKCTFETKNFDNVQIDEVVKIHIKVMESSGKVCPEEQDVTVELHHLRDLSTTQLEATSVEPGLYLAEITPRDRGRNMLAIKVNSRHIFGSPTPMFVHIPPQKLGALVATIEGLKNPVGLHKWNGQILACEQKKRRLLRIDSKFNTAVLVNTESSPNQLSSDSSLNIFMTTHPENCVHKLNRLGQVLATTGTTGSGKDQFRLANGIKVFNNKLYVCDSLNHHIKMYDLNLNLIEVIGRKGTELGQFQLPDDLTFDQDGNMYVTDQRNNRIQVFSPQKQPLREYPLDQPISVHYDSQNEYLYVTRFYNNSVTVMTTSGDFVADFGTDHLEFPEGLEIDDDGFVYVTSHRSKILVF